MWLTVDVSCRASVYKSSTFYQVRSFIKSYRRFSSFVEKKNQKINGINKKQMKGVLGFWLNDMRDWSGKQFVFLFISSCILISLPEVWKTVYVVLSFYTCWQRSVVTRSTENFNPWLLPSSGGFAFRPWNQPRLQPHLGVLQESSSQHCQSCV